MKHTCINIKLLSERPKGYPPVPTLVLVGVEPEDLPFRPQQAAPEEGVDGDGGAQTTEPGGDGGLEEPAQEIQSV